MAVRSAEERVQDTRGCTETRLPWYSLVTDEGEQGVFLRGRLLIGPNAAASLFPFPLSLPSPPSSFVQCRSTARCAKHRHPNVCYAPSAVPPCARATSPTLSVPRLRPKVSFAWQHAVRPSLPFPPPARGAAAGSRTPRRLPPWCASTLPGEAPPPSAPTSMLSLVPLPPRPPPRRPSPPCPRQYSAPPSSSSSNPRCAAPTRPHPPPYRRLLTVPNGRRWTRGSQG